MEDEVIAQSLTVADWVTAGGVFVLGIVAGRVLRSLLTRRIGRDDADPPAASLVGRFGGYLLVLAGLVYALAILDVRLGPLLGAIGIGGIAVALAAQSILSNFLASIILQVRRPFRRGDQVCTNDCEGEVEEVNFRTVVLRTYDGERVLVPCAEVLDSPIVNYTVRGRRRTTLEVSVAYRTDLAKARAVLERAVRSVDGVLAKPSPEALVESFGESGINFAVRYWHAPDIVTVWRVRSLVAMAVKRALDDAGIEIPFPQRVVHVETDGDGGENAGPGDDSVAARLGLHRPGVGGTGQRGEDRLPASDADRPPDVVPGDTKQPSNRAIDEQAESEPLDLDEGPDRVVTQSERGRANVEGVGEWPEPDAEPRGPAPGTDEGLRQEIEERRRQP